MNLDKLPKEYADLDFSMSDFQIRHFVVGSQHNLYRQFKQILLELEVRLTTEETVELDMRKNLAEQKLYDEKISVESSPAQREIYEIEKEKLAKAYENNVRALDRTRNEINSLKTILDEFKEKNDVKALLENKDTLEEDYWVKRLATQSALEMLTVGRVGQGNLEALLQMGQDNFKRTLIEATKITNSVNDTTKYLDMMDPAAQIEAGEGQTKQING